MGSSQIAHNIRENQPIKSSLVWEEFANDGLKTWVTDKTIPVEPNRPLSRYACRCNRLGNKMLNTDSTVELIWL